MKVKFDTADFERAHGRKPRGEGHWCFEVALGDGQGGWTDGKPVEHVGLFSEAKQAAKRSAFDEATLDSRVSEAVVFVGS